MYQQQCFEHIVVTRPDTAALKPRGPVVQGIYHPSPPEGAGDQWVQCRTEDRTGIRSQDGPLQPSPVPEEADGPHGCECPSMLWVSLHYIF